MADGQKPRPGNELITMAMSLAKRAGTRLDFDLESVQPERLRVKEQETVQTGFEGRLTTGTSAPIVQPVWVGVSPRLQGSRWCQPPDQRRMKTGPILDRFWTDLSRGWLPPSVKISISVLSGTLWYTGVLAPT